MLGLASKAFCLKGLQRIMDVNTWHTVGAQINGGHGNYDWVEVLLPAGDHWAGIGGLPWDQPNPSQQNSWVWALPGEVLCGPHFVFRLTCQQLPSNPRRPGKRFCSPCPGTALDPSVDALDSDFPADL